VLGRRFTAPTLAPPAAEVSPAPTVPDPTPAAAPVDPAPALVVVTASGHAYGPPGVGLALSGNGYQSCERVRIFLDADPGRRIGSATPDGSGAFHVSDLSMPGDAPVGPHRITTSCATSATPVLAAADFRVTAASVHRSALMTSLSDPGQVDWSAGQVGRSAGLVLATVTLVAFPFQLFNKTLEENYERLRAVVGLRRRLIEEQEGGVLEGLMLFGLLVLTGFLYAFLSPDFGWNRTTLVSWIGLAGATLVTGIGFAIPIVLYRTVRTHERGRLRVLPGSLLPAIVSVVLSRVVNFQPGYIYGVLAVWVFREELGKAVQGRLAAATSVFILVVSLAAWLGRAPVARAAARPGASIGLVVAELLLGGVFLLGLESLLINLLPLRFLDGSRILAWNKAVWTALFAVTAFAVYHVLLGPRSGYVGKATGSQLVVLVLYAGFGVFSVGFWAYFRLRPAPRRPGPADEPDDAAVELVAAGV
jgi:hypothetical protein